MSFLINSYVFGTAGGGFHPDDVSILYFNGTNGSTTFTDELGLLSWTAGGNAQISTTGPIEGSGSLTLDGSGDYIYSDSQAALDFGTGDYCIELFAKFSSVGNTGLFHLHPTAPPPSATSGVALAYNNNLGVMTVYANGVNTFTRSNSTGVAYHFALYRVSGLVYVAVDGDVLGSVSDTTNISSTRLTVGTYFSDGYGHNGTLDALRIRKGSSPYGAVDFTPPSLPYPQVPPQDPNFSSVVSILHMDGSDGSTTFTDVKGKTWTSYNGAQIDTAQSKFGGASGLFDGTNDYISTPDSADWDFGTGDFTVEVWARFNSFASTQTLVGNYQNATFGWTLQYRSDTGGIRFGHGDSPLIDQAWSPSAGVWYHIAVTRNGTDLKIFVDGTQLGITSSNSTNISGSSNALLVGALIFGGPLQHANGWLDDLRITKGVARYTANFTPPTAPHPDS